MFMDDVTLESVDSNFSSKNLNVKDSGTDNDNDIVTEKPRQHKTG